MAPITMFLGSPRKKGNTAHVLEKTIELLKQRGHSPETVFLPDHNIAPCAECFGCQRVSDLPACVIQDGMQEMYEKILSSDTIIFASPVFFWSFAAQIKPFIDRFFCFGKYESEPMVSLLEGKKCAIIITAGGDEFDGADLMAAGFSKMAALLKMTNMGNLIVDKYTSNEILDGSETTEKIAEFVNKLLK